MASKSKRKNKNIALVLFVIIVIIVGLIISSLVFFKVENITCNSTNEYTSEEIIEKSGVNVGESLLFLNNEYVEQSIVKNFPYIESAQVIKKFPFSVEITVSSAEAFFNVQYNSQYVLASKFGKLLDISDTPIQGSTNLLVGEIKDVDGYMEIADDSTSDAFEEIILAIANVESGKITEIDLTDLSDIIITYDDRIIMEIGDVLDLTYKINFGMEIVEYQIEETEKGTLDLSLSKEKNMAYFDPEYGEDEEIYPEEDDGQSSTQSQTEPESSEESAQSDESSSQSESSESNRGNDIPDV